MGIAAESEDAGAFGDRLADLGDRAAELAHALGAAYREADTPTPT